MRRRSAQFVANLVVYDEPHVIYLLAKKSPILAVAIEPSTDCGDDFFAASISARTWERYRQGTVDLRYALAYSKPRTNFTFSSSALKNGKVMMTPFEGKILEIYLPDSGFFSDDHTEEFDLERIEGETEDHLYIDGEWAVNEFGSFYQKYSDLYFFSSTIEALKDTQTPQRTVAAIKKSFASRPFQGGGSYVHLFDDFEQIIPREKRLALEGIMYNSPGEVRISGSASQLQQVESWVNHFISKQDALNDKYRELRQYLSKRKLLTASPASYDHTDSDYLKHASNELYGSLSLGSSEKIYAACGNHSLVFAKVVLSIFRRIAGTAGYFAEGRMSFDERE